VAFAGVGDILHFSPAAEFLLESQGPFAEALPPPQGNIILKARDYVEAVAARRGLRIPPCALRLTKNLPVASGIGGGSANAAAAIRGFAALAGLSIDEDLRGGSLSIGADVPVCLLGRACRMGGVGERLQVLPRPPAAAILLVNPGVEVATAAVFDGLGLKPGDGFGPPLDPAANPASWRNDLAAPAIRLAPVIAEVLDRLSRIGSSRHHAMSGSGATCFALFDDIAQARRAAGLVAAEQPSWWVAAATLA
jgi:4-diphosphocytidyl-2-C-methyl-D-erythritol kinase